MKIEILKASRSNCNESTGRDMAGCLAHDERVVCYFPTESSMAKHAPLIAAAPELYAFARAYLDMTRSVTARGTTARPTAAQLNALFDQARAAISKAERGAE